VKRIVSLVLVALVILPACQEGSTGSLRGTRSPLPAELEPVRTHIRQLVEDGSVPSMAIAVTRDGTIVWEEGFGYADSKGELEATEHIPYALASISKPLTATGLMLLVERGLVDLDAPVNDYLGEAQLVARVGDVDGATVRRVAGHTSGLPLHSQHYYAGDPAPPPMTTTIERYGQLVTAPGERWQYANIGYGLLGQVIEQVSSQSYANFMRDELFTPLGMENTWVATSTDPDPRVATKLTANGIIIPPYLSDCPGASNVHSTAHDLILFAQSLLAAGEDLTSSILTGESIAEMQQPSPGTGPSRPWERDGSGYGIGWSIGVTDQGLRVVMHNGGTAGVSTVLALVPEEDLAVAVLSNTHGDWPDVILVETLCALQGLDPAQFLPPAETLSQNALEMPPDLEGHWTGAVSVPEDELPLEIEIDASAAVTVTLADQPRRRLQDITYRERAPHLLNLGGGPYLRGWVRGDLHTADASRGQPHRLWLELKLRDEALSGVLIVFSQREPPTGPLSYWITMSSEPAR